LTPIKTLSFVYNEFILTVLNLQKAADIILGLLILGSQSTIFNKKSTISVDNSGEKV